MYAETSISVIMVIIAMVYKFNALNKNSNENRKRKNTAEIIMPLVKMPENPDGIKY